MIDAATKFRKTDRQISCPINENLAILDTQRALYFGLEGVAVEVWEALEQPRSVAELRDGIVARFDVSPVECERDLRRLLAELRDLGLVETAA